MPTMRVLVANDRIHIGLIGTSDRGLQDLRDALQQPNIEWVAVADVYSRRREFAKSKLPNIETHDDPMRLLDRKDIDAVINATPFHLHTKYFVAALAAGKDLYSEKTMTWDIREAVTCLKAASNQRRSCRLDCNMRALAYWPSSTECPRTCRQTFIGTTRCARTTQSHTSGQP
jgi:predicted dehydrogenase